MDFNIEALTVRIPSSGKVRNASIDEIESLLPHRHHKPNRVIPLMFGLRQNSTPWSAKIGRLQ